MFHKRNLWIVFILLLISTLPIAHCKKNSTTPNMDVLASPVIWLNTNSIAFTASANGANPSSQTLQIKNSGQQTLNYALSSESEWVSISPTEGSSSGQTVEHTISVNKTGLAPQNEDYTAKIQILCDQAFNNPQEVTVSLKVYVLVLW